MAEIITIGETMAAFAPKEPGYLHYVREYTLRIAGAESNLAIGACKLGHSASWISLLGDDELGCFVLDSIRAEGVETRYVQLREEHPTGMMVKQILPGKETSVFYYREHSAASHMRPEMLRPEMLSGGKILHLTGITPVLSGDCLDMMCRAVAMAKEAGLWISFDPNIRRKLWKGTDYTPTLRELAQSADILTLGLDEAKTLYGTEKKEEISGLFFQNGCARYLAIKDGSRGAYVADRNGGCDIAPYPCSPIDPIGAGDAFDAGFLCGLLEGKSVREAGRIAAAAGALATESSGDIEGYPTRRTLRRMLEKTQPDIYR